MTFLELIVTAAIIGISAQGLMAGFRMYNGMYQQVKIDLATDRMLASMIGSRASGGAQQSSPSEASTRFDEDLMDELPGMRYNVLNVMDESACTEAVCPGLIKVVLVRSGVVGMLLAHYRWTWGDKTRDIRVLVPQ